MRFRFAIASTECENPTSLFPESPTISSLSEIRIAILSGKQSPWDNEDTRFAPLDYYTHEPNLKIAIRELGRVGSFNDFMGYL